MHKLIRDDKVEQYSTQWQLAEAIGMTASDKKSIENRCKRLGYSVIFASKEKRSHSTLSC